MHDLQVDVAAQRVDQVVAADREHVAVAADHPHVEVGARQRDAGRDRRRTAVDRVQAVGVHVVREARRAADARHEHQVLGLARRGRRAAAASRRGSSSRRSPGTSGPPGPTGSPCGVERDRGAAAVRIATVDHLHRISRSCSISAARNGRPCTLRERCGVDEELGADEPRQLAEVHLRHEHLRVPREHLTEVRAGTG